MPLMVLALSKLSCHTHQRKRGEGDRWGRSSIGRQWGLKSQEGKRLIKKPSRLQNQVTNRYNPPSPCLCSQPPSSPPAIPERGCTCAGEIRPSEGPLIVPPSAALFVIPTDESRGRSGSQPKNAQESHTCGEKMLARKHSRFFNAEFGSDSEQWSRELINNWSETVTGLLHSLCWWRQITANYYPLLFTWGL